MEIGVGRGKRLYDKRESLKVKEDRREIARGLRGKGWCPYWIKNFKKLIEKSLRGAKRRGNLLYLWHVIASTHLPNFTWLKIYSELYY